MEYIRKVCPTCGNEFVVLEDVEEKAIFCTIECLLEFQHKMKESEISFLLPV